MKAPRRGRCRHERASRLFGLEGGQIMGKLRDVSRGVTRRVRKGATRPSGRWSRRPRASCDRVATASGFSTTFEVSGNTLHVRGELGPEEEKDFAGALREFATTNCASHVTIDFSEVRYLSSCHLGHLVFALMDLKGMGATVALRARKRVRHVLEISGLAKLATIECAD